MLLELLDISGLEYINLGKAKNRIIDHFKRLNVR